ncbi:MULTISPECIES: TAXI family TRAP transporter solute-binding subunit [Bacillaceae]|uniref:TAXI family TRAP transporter solute-binding subunit n=1 Tax=Evansella alkalicola TaxID=745819 RepID=A0ABS6JT67_9BACI|nr:MULTISPECIES: TAXI family TRAP transporter solute-binding subunit [Bacillaceae]MBU9721698.1 TAXI family TRAP transporter solute-binding subunit [Bacillus alkalicola]
MVSKLNKKRFLIVGILIATLVVFSACNGENEDIVFGSSTEGSYGYIVFEAFSSVLNDHVEDARYSAVATDGNVENIVLMFNGDIDGGHTSNIAMMDAWEGKGPFGEGEYNPVQLLSYGSLTQAIVVPEDSDIQTIQDLEGKDVQFGTPGSGLDLFWSLYFELADIEVNPVYLDISEQGDAFIGGRTDTGTLLFRNGEPYPLNMEVEAAMDIRYIPLDPEVNKMMEDAGFPAVTISPDVSEYMHDPLELNGAPMVFAVKPDMSEDLAYTITKTLVENVDDLMAITPHLETVSPENVTSGLIETLPVHPGAVKYFKEAGIWEDRLMELE